jgi:hypothetical protein
MYYLWTWKWGMKFSQYSDQRDRAHASPASANFDGLEESQKKSCEVVNLFQAIHRPGAVYKALYKIITWATRNVTLTPFATPGSRGPFAW